MTFWDGFNKLASEMPPLGKGHKMLYLDLDGVLADFEGRVRQLGIKDLRNTPPATLWKLVDSTENFWATLPWTSDGKVLWHYVRKFSPTILTAPSRNPSSRVGKRAWVDKQIGLSVPVVFSPKMEKHYYSGPKAILVDDQISNIRQWTDAGGIGILHTSAANTIQKLRPLLEG